MVHTNKRHTGFISNHKVGEEVKEMEMTCIDKGFGTDCKGETCLQNWTPLCDTHADERQERTSKDLKALAVREDYHF